MFRYVECGNAGVSTVSILGSQPNDLIDPRPIFIFISIRAVPEPPPDEERFKLHHLTEWNGYQLLKL